MTHISELVDPNLMENMVREGFIRVQHDINTGYEIYNYTEKATFDRVWNEATRISRGLILDYEKNVVARPFPKFFNYGEVMSPVLHPDMGVIASDKMDGSLGIVYVTPDNDVRVATRGSFQSDQAVHATKVLNEKYPEWVEYTQKYVNARQVTPLFEIIYPENRIVCDYGKTDDLVLIGWIHIATGRYFGPDRGYWDGPRAETFEFETLMDVMQAPDRDGKEGFVLYIPEIHDWVKIKQEDYVELHRIVTGLSARRVYEAMMGDQNLLQISAPLPDEFHDFVREVYYQLLDDALEIIDQVYDECNRIMDGLDREDPEFRKKFALQVKGFVYQGLVFKVLDEKSIHLDAWKLVRPSAEWTPATHDQYRRL